VGAGIHAGYAGAVITVSGIILQEGMIFQCVVCLFHTAVQDTYVPNPAVVTIVPEVVHVQGDNLVVKFRCAGRVILDPYDPGAVGQSFQCTGRDFHGDGVIGVNDVCHFTTQGFNQVFELYMLLTKLF
jgi:hypothetical protein